MSGQLGKPVLRKEDPALLSGRGRYADDLPIPVGTLHAHVVRSPHAHAEIARIDIKAALALDGVWAVITGEDVRRLSDPFLTVVKTPIQQWALAVERVRYVGEPVALVVAENRYIAEDAGELVEVEYQPLEPVIDPEIACESSAPLLHPEAKTNQISVRDFSYGDTKAAFARADRRIATKVTFPRQSFTPIECYVVVAQHNPAKASYDVLANFQGPFSMHPVMARALRVPGPKLRLRIPPDSGGSFGIKLSVFPYIVLTALAAKVTGRPVKWVEDRIEHLVAASSGPNRVTAIEAAVNNDGRILGLKLDQLEDYGAFLRAPMPGPLYRMHGSVTGAYDIDNVDVTNRVVLTNKMPASLIRGFGGPQLYLAIERLMQRIAVELKLDPLDVIRRNLIPAAKFPYRTAAGALYDSGDYARAVEIAVGDGRLDDLKRRRDAARAAGRQYGIGFAAVVEPAMSNMGYLSTLLTPQVREKAGPKNGAVSMATVNIDPLGAVTRHRRRHGAGPEPRDGAGADRRRGARAVHRRCRSGAGTGHRQGPMVDRGRHLFQPLRRRHRGRRAHGGRPDAGQDQGHRRQAAQCAARRCRTVRRQSAKPLQSRQCAAVQPRRRHLELGADVAARRHGAGLERNRGLDAARA